MDLLSQLFLPHEASAILSLLLSRNGAKDSFAWKGTTTVTYTVRSGYHSLTSSEYTEEEETRRSWWRYLWGLSLPSKLKNFTWRLCHNSLPTRDNIRRRGIDIDTCCECCQMPIETSEHLLFECSFAHSIWVRSQLDPRQHTGQDPSWLSWFVRLRQTRTPLHMAEIISILWSIWTSRNNRIFQGLAETEQVVLIRGGKLLTDYQAANTQSVPTHPQAAAPEPRWYPPTPGHLKLNTDASICGEGAGLGFAARYSDGRILFTGALFEPGITDPAIGEALAIRQALFQACALIHEPVLLESGCLGLIQALQNPCLPDNYVGLVLHDVRYLAGRLSNCVFSHVRRGANSLAHELSRHALISRSGNVWVGGCPEAIRPIVNSEFL